MSAAVGVLVMSHGTPATREEIEPFYTRIRHGRPPPAVLLEDLVRRYEAIGGLSPLAARTAAQVRGLAEQLDLRAPRAFSVVGATKYATPSIEEGAERVVELGATTVVGFVLSPLNAPSSTDAYHGRAEAALAGRVRYLPVWSWWDEPAFAPLVARRVRRAVEACSSTPLVVFTAHSLPTRIAGVDEYHHQLAMLASAVADAAAVTNVVVAWQSAGRTDDEWLGPGLTEVLHGLDGTTADVVVCPVGFVADHLEVLYDVDVEASKIAASKGIALHRTASLNDSEDFLAMLAALVGQVATGA